MIITIICDVLGKENNGTTIAIMNLIRYLSSKGHTVRVVSTNKAKNGNVDYYVLPVMNWGPFNPIFAKNGVVPAKADTKILMDAIKDCDLVHTTLVFGVCRKAIKIAKKYHKPITSSFHCQAENLSAHLGLMNFRPASNIIYRDYYRHIYQYSDAIHYPTQFMKDTFEKAIGKDTPGYVISNGVNDIFQKRQIAKPDGMKNKFIILSIGRLSAEKNHDILIKAVALSKYASRIKVIIAGDGPRRLHVEHLAKKLGVDLDIRFFSRKELSDVINYSDLYIHTAKVDLESIACLEALASGLVPIIMESDLAATKAFALDDYSLFSYENYKELSDKIDFWMDNPDLRRQYSLKYVDAMKKFNQKSCMESMENMMIETARRYRINAKDHLLQRPQE